MTADTSELMDVFHGIADRIHDDMSETDVQNAFLNEQFFTKLGYEGAGKDLRSEFTLPDNRRPDYLTVDSNDAVTAVYEFKSPDRKLAGHEDQLFHYLDVLKAEYGVLTNGKKFLVYRREDKKLVTPLDIFEPEKSKVSHIRTSLRKPEWDIRDPQQVAEFLEDLDGVALDTELGREHFYDTFRLEEGSPFADLVTSMMDLLQELREAEETDFVEGAYDFWEATYASEPEEVPNSWETYLDGSGSLRDLMFSLESGHALLARLLLAKATEDHDFFDNTGYDGMQGYFRGLSGFGDEINLEAFPVAATDLIDDMQQKLVEGLFQDDIFVWWTEAFESQLSRGHTSGRNRFEEIAQEPGQVEKVSEATKEWFSRAVAELFFNVLRFDFAEMEGDLLGDLYQQYFDPETRKALGEFYTPQPVVDYIMDGVEYERGVSQERLIDPACGSGTFLIEAVDRYIDDVEYYESDPNWENHIKNLCSKPRIVGLDVHPFAVLMAQIRFVVAILPAYRKAKRENPEFTIRRLPIYRTDTLRNERDLTGVDIGEEDQIQMTFDAMTEDSQDVRIPVPLPIEIEDEEDVETEDGFLVRRVRMPLFDTIKLQTDIRNFDEYFSALQGVLDTVKDHIALSEQFGGDYDWEYSSGLEDRINEYTSREYSGLEEFFEPYVNDMLENVRYLKEEHNDGRLFKMLEDAVLSLVVKNYMEYDYVVGNPPYVRIQNLPDKQKQMMDTLYEATTGNYDIYCPFYERGLDWLREDSGKLGFITPNQFMVTDYGEGLRRVILQNSSIREVYDFRDSGVFEDATNYPAIVILEDEPDSDARDKNTIRSVRVKSSTDEDSTRELDKEILDSVRKHRDEPGYSDEFIDVFDFPQAELDNGYWSLMPPEELRVIRNLRNESDFTVGELTDSVFAGTQTSANDVFLVKPVNTDRVGPGDNGDTVRIVPKGESREYEIETDVLRPWLQGRDIERWRGSWSGQHVILPYDISRDNEGSLNAELLDEEYLKAELPLTWDYLESHRSKLEKREGGRFEGRDDWYDFGYPKSMDRFENPKLIGAEIASDATFMLDEDGSWYFKSAYGIQLEPQHQDKTNLFAGLLNSAALDFYLKHFTSLKMGGYYKYTTSYLDPLPIVWDDSDNISKIQNAISKIVAVYDRELKTERFPEAYLGEFEGDLQYIDYEWNTRRYPVKASIQETVDAEFKVTAGRSDEILAPAMHANTREDRKRRAEYVLAAVDGRKVKKGEEVTIPIPKTNAGVEELLSKLETDESTVNSTDIETLEQKIDEAVYDLFDLSPDDREVIENYLEVF